MVESHALRVGARYHVEYVGSGLTIRALKGAVLIDTRGGPGGDEYEFETRTPVTTRVVAVRPELIVRAESH